MGLSSFNRARERQQMTEAKINQLEDQLATLKGEFIAFQNDPEAMKARIVELESGNNGQKSEDGQKPSDTQPQPINYAGLKVDELRAVLTEKGIAFEAGAKKEELLALIPKE
ncbi:HeH/LEM domain-containing protein [Acinetobacter baumannii]|uniref:HeH/LEM domain-containing protein n=1 Tax=Acinetobacter baumannii TaxID=470 RepID=UPI000DE67212|nr:HeH/LEM domain-containing protein [Acinetobacter baumannii]MDC5615260.1 HeH/LEM domain-containing protein [Acinetobacter baumannii]MDV7480517.1 HeH/LEM domain-containing protein [Acinetobacter baumannii]SSS76956.1 Putative stress-responsive nuclear envelope protein [Acinetobacter baumannii]